MRKPSQRNYVLRWMSALLVFASATGLASAVSCDADAYALAVAVNDFRAAKGLPRLPISSSLTTVAENHADNPYTGSGSGCNLHSWGGKYACCYTSNHANPKCMWNKPTQITNGAYTANGFEVSSSGFGSNAAAVQGWYSSSGHRVVILSEANWKTHTKSIGCGIAGRVRHCWFSGSATDSQGLCKNGGTKEETTTTTPTTEASTKPPADSSAQTTGAQTTVPERGDDTPASDNANIQSLASALMWTLMCVVM